MLLLMLTILAQGEDKTIFNFTYPGYSVFLHDQQEQVL